MNESTMSYINYLNGLHNYNAQNQNAYGERNVESPYYKKTIVPMEICDHIVNSIKNNEPHIIILTGHAGDGKTSIMYQVLESLGVSKGFKEATYEFDTKEGAHVYCIKDFSEFSDEDKLIFLKNIVTYPEKGKFVFMVANTGPLINTFGQLFDIDSRENAQMHLIEAMNSNDGEIKDIEGFKINVINIASIDNTSFLTRFLDNILKEDLWSSCKDCKKCGYCHIFRNKNLILEYKDSVYEFIKNFYIWQLEYGVRLTIRSMTEHLAYMITGGDECSTVCPNASHEKLFANLFFGYEGVIANPIADNILAVNLAKNSRIYLKRLRADEDLLIRRDYKYLFGKTLYDIIMAIDDKIKSAKEFDDEMRRLYMFMGIKDDKQNKKDIEDIFSKQFIPYLAVRDKEEKPSKHQKALVIDAIRMIYTGSVIDKSTHIPITMGSEGGITQSVQLIAGDLNTNDIELKSEPDSILNSKHRKLLLRVKKKNLCTLTLPMLNHFEELRSGVIATNMDPQLSHGIENLKAKILELADTDDDEFNLLVMSNTGYIPKSFSIEDGIIELR